jgi:hypothetical protein
MRSLLAGCALLMLGSAAAEAQPYFGGPPAYGWGWHHPHPMGWGWHRARPWGWGPPRRCWWVQGFYGPHRVCRGW